jgi:succinoglycan biosynthesis protein ExoA
MSKLQAGARGIFPSIILVEFFADARSSISKEQAERPASKGGHNVVLKEEYSNRKALIVIPALNEAKQISSIILGLEEQLADDDDALIVVVDGGSVDGTQSIVQRLASKHSRVRLLHNPKRVQSAGVNLAVERHGIDRDVIIRCDAHSGYPTNFIYRLIASLEANKADAVAVVLDSYGHSRLQRAIAWASNSLIGSGGSGHRGGQKSGFVDHGHHAAVRVAKFLEIGGYDPTFTHNEDAEFDFRLRAFGGRIYLDADIRIKYEPRATLRSLWRQYFNYGLGRSRTMRRHPTSVRLRQIAVPFNMVLNLGCLALAPFTRTPLLWPAMYVAALSAGAALLVLQKRSFYGLLAFPAAFVMHNAWASGFLYGIVRVSEKRWSVPVLHARGKPMGIPSDMTA